MAFPGLAGVVVRLEAVVDFRFGPAAAAVPLVEGTAAKTAEDTVAQLEAVLARIEAAAPAAARKAQNLAEFVPAVPAAVPAAIPAVEADAVASPDDDDHLVIGLPRSKGSSLATVRVSALLPDNTLFADFEDGSTAGELIPAVKRQNPLYVPSKTEIYNDWSLIGKVRVMVPGGSPPRASTEWQSINEVSEVEIERRESIVSVSSIDSAVSNTDPKQAEIPMSPTLTPAVLQAMSESDRLEILHKVRLGNMSIDEAVASAEGKAGAPKKSKKEAKKVAKAAARSSAADAAEGARTWSTGSSGASAQERAIRGGQWREMEAKLDGSTITLGAISIEVQPGVKLSLIQNIPTDGLCSIQITELDGKLVYFYPDSVAKTKQWFALFEDCLEQSKKRRAKLNEPGGGDLGAPPSASQTPAASAANSPTKMLGGLPSPTGNLSSPEGDAPTPPPRATRPNTMYAGYAGEGAARAADQAEADGEFSKLGERSSTTTSQRRRTFGARSSFRKRASSKSLGGGAIMPEVEGVNNKRVSTVKEDTVKGPEVVMDECDERVGEMEAETATAAAEYLHVELERLKATMQSCYDGGTNAGYSTSYQSMRLVGTDQTAIASAREFNRLKNRYGNIVAYDRSRVQLDVINGDPDTDYVNANWIDGFERPKAYIATQGPVPNSFISFWRMIWLCKIETIVMVTHEIEKGRMKCHRYWPDPTSTPPSKQTQYGMINVTHVITQNHKNFFLRVFDVEWNGEKRQLKQFAYTSWPDHGVPMTSSELLGFRNAVRNSRTNREIPLLVHCSAGVGRTGTYIAIDRVLEQTLALKPGIDIDSIMRDMRMARNFMVQTEIQYIYLYRAIYDALCELYAEETDKAQIEAQENSRKAQLEAEREATAAAEAARLAVEAEERAIEEARAAFEEEIRLAEEAKRREVDLLHQATTEHSVAAAKAIIKTSILDRVTMLDQAEERWLAQYRVSLEEWNDRNQFDAEDYDVASQLTPIQSRLQALKQHALFTDTMVPPVRK